jgi:hypothetical protein
VGVIAEGPADFAVVRSVLKAVLGLDAADVDSIRPDLQTDETSLHTPSAGELHPSLASCRGASGAARRRSAAGHLGSDEPLRASAR